MIDQTKERIHLLEQRIERLTEAHEKLVNLGEDIRAAGLGSEHLAYTRASIRDAVRRHLAAQDKIIVAQQMSAPVMVDGRLVSRGAALAAAVMGPEDSRGS